jgi:hypothetical protein
MVQRRTCPASSANETLAIANIGWKFYIIFAVLNLTWAPFIWYFYVETAGLSLEEMDLVFALKFKGGKSITYEEARRQVFEMRDQNALKVSEKGMQVSQEDLA